MKSTKVLCAIGILTLFLSCSYQEDTAAFFINNQLNESLTLQRSPENSSSSDIYGRVDIDLTSSESYEQYILRLTDLDITKLDCTFNEYQGSITNGQLFLDDVLLGNFQGSNGHVSITDSQMLRSLAERFLEKTSLDLTFVGESDTDHFLSVNVEIEMMGTFVH
jgi:hypothetical protein